MSGQNPQDATPGAVAGRLRAAIERGGGITLTAKLSGVPARSIAHYLAGREMRVSTLAALADVCCVKAQWLMFGGEPLRANDNRPAVDQPQADIEALGKWIVEENHRDLPTPSDIDDDWIGCGPRQFLGATDATLTAWALQMAAQAFLSIAGERLEDAVGTSDPEERLVLKGIAADYDLAARRLMRLALS